MLKTNSNNKLELPRRMTVTTDSLVEYLGCGRSTAVKIGEAAKARIQIGKRVLWNVELIQAYVDSISTGKNQDIL